MWQLYHLEADRAQMHNLADQEPERLEQLRDLWFYNAGIYNGLPLDDRSALEQVLAERPDQARPAAGTSTTRTARTFPRRPESRINGRSYTIAAGVELESADAQGVLFAHGGVAGGHSLYVMDRRLHYVYNWVGTKLQEVVADRDLTPGRHVLTAEFATSGPNTDPAMPGFTGTLTLFIDEEPAGSTDLVTQPGPFCLVGDGICVGRDSASPVTPAYTRRSRSRAARSSGSSSTSRVTPSSTTRPRCEHGWRGTRGRWPGSRCEEPQVSHGDLEASRPIDGRRPDVL